ncbi:MAG: LCP family protein [Firmicutes bacterium]|nr:LCP family protein [Bacillota bacterium]
MSGSYRSRSFRKFVMSFTITCFLILAVVGGAYAALRMSIRPPEIPEFVEITRPVPRAPVINQLLPSAPGVGDIPTEYGELPSDYLREYETVIFQRRPNFFTFLFYGLDDGNNVDAIMVAAFDGETGNAYLISLPRDTRVDVQRSNGRRKLVASYAAGRANGGGHAGGVEQIKTDVSTLIGFRPDLYVGINQRAFVRLIDALGGVEVTVPFRLVYNDPYQNLHIDLAGGRRTLNGQQALHFARFRQFNEGCPHFRNYTDFQRVESHQQIISAAMQELLSPRTISRVPELIRIYIENVNTNMDAMEIGWFVEQLPGLRADTMLSTYTLPIARTVRQGWYEMPDRDAVLELINRTINPFKQEITAEMLRIVE